MSTTDPIRQLRAHFQLPDIILFLRIATPLLNEQGRACLPYLESELNANPSAARLSISTLSSSRSARSLASTFDRSSSGMGFSETSSVHSNFMLDDGLPGPQHALVASNQRKYKQPPGHRVGKPAHKTSATSSPILSPRKPSFECPFCWELKIPTSISRKADLKRHFKQFHQNNVQWICQERGCSRAFDWKSAFEAHLKESHGNTQHPSDSHQVKLCPQVVFACGFSNCRLVFEATTDEDAEKKASEYFNHVANHFDDNLTHRNWSFSVRIRNLMRQAAVEPHWKDRKKGTQDPVWQPHTSSVVRKILETRHFTDIPLLVQWVVNLGSFAFSQPHSPLPKLPAELRLPIKENCTLVVDGHGPLVRQNSHRHMSIDQAAPPQRPERAEVEPAPPVPESIPEVVPEKVPEPIPKREPDVDPEPELEPEPEPEPAEPEQQVIEHQQHHQQNMVDPTSNNSMSLPMTTFDSSEPTGGYTTFNDTLMMDTHHQMSMATAAAAAAAAATIVGMPSFVDSQPGITHWLGMTETPPLPMHNLDTIMSYSSQGFGGAGGDFRPTTPGHNQQHQQHHHHHQHHHPGLLGGHHDGFGNIIGQQTQQQSTIAPVDLEMGDCPYDTDVKHF
ncbi:hypothetical protein QBC47DRAFT_398073 [Echria macrotheca]|uniref:C2H2-type domain-containing protein n=1 Tax=Echria macrotheca TaxID=438768 RepID=A0AAJ0BL88_9PEZI|nr:hypothetical protein QBC47DRAFT_398073 [Echria macrotheca]